MLLLERRMTMNCDVEYPMEHKSHAHALSDFPWIWLYSFFMLRFHAELKPGGVIIRFIKKRLTGASLGVREDPTISNSKVPALPNVTSAPPAFHPPASSHSCSVSIVTI